MNKLFKCELCGIILTEDNPNFIEISPEDFEPRSIPVYPYKFHNCYSGAIGFAKFIGFDTHGKQYGRSNGY